MKKISFKKLHIVLNQIQSQKFNEFIKAFDQVCIIDDNNKWVAVNTEESLLNYQRQLKLLEEEKAENQDFQV